MSLRVLIAVTHLLGAGHLTRAAALARAFAQKGHETTLASGGLPALSMNTDGFTLVQLPPVRILGTDFRTLLDEAGAPIDNVRLEQRRTLLLQTLKSVQPDILITELFPFGRRVLANEFTALLDKARAAIPRPLILCSIRDVLATPKPERIEETHQRILRNYDAILVHGDPQLIPLEASWPVDERIKPLVRYTGYVDENENPVSNGARRGIIVSGGSSAAGLPLYRAAVAAAQEIADRPWRILIGRGVTEDDFQALKAQSPAHAEVERARPDFRVLLAQAELSVSQAGYNTVVDIMRSGVRPVLIPFEAGHETEQRLRAERLKELGHVEIVTESELSPQRLAEAIRWGLSQASSLSPAPSLDGAQRSVAIAESLAPAHPFHHQAVDWSALDRSLDRAREQSCPVSFWWRDDDAMADTPQLDRLLALARRVEAGIALAVIPRNLEASLAGRLAEEDLAAALVHGWSHANHAPAREKKAEFAAHRPIEVMMAEADQSLHTARKHLGAKLLPVFVPPWNRIAPGLLPALPRAGYRAISTFQDRSAAHPAEGLLQVNTHVDPVDWHGTRSLADPAAIVAALAAAIDRRITGAADRSEPIGFLTHHLVHDEAIWSFCERLAEYLASKKIRFLPIGELFPSDNRITVEL